MTKPRPKPKTKPRSNGKHPGGRPPTYRNEFVEQARKLCDLGATDMELANFFGVRLQTITRWKSSHPQFCAALKLGKEIPNERVKRSLYNRAIGYSYESEKIFLPAGAKKAVRVKVIEHVPPETLAAIFFLKNREPGEWRDRTEQLIERKADPEEERQRAQLVQFFATEIERRARLGLPSIFDEGNTLPAPKPAAGPQIIDVTPKKPNGSNGSNGSTNGNGNGHADH